MDVQTRVLKRIRDVAGYAAGPPEIASPGANTNFFGATGVAVGAQDTRLCVAIALSALAKLKVFVGPTSPNGFLLYEGTQLVAGALYEFPIDVDAGETVNFQIDQNVNVQRFLLTSLPAGTSGTPSNK